jgi:hypothetical protein
MTKPDTRPTYASKIRIAAAILLVGLLTPAAATITAGTCQTATAKFINSDRFRSTHSTISVNLPDTAITFTQGAAHSCVIVYFFGQVGTDADTAMHLFATLDGAGGAIAGATQLIADSTSAEARASNFVFPDVAIGPHTVRLQYHGTLDHSVYVYESNVVVHYAP